MATENCLLEVPCANEQSTEVRIVKSGCRKRKANFSAHEIAIITQTFEENQSILKSKLTNTNKMKQSVWEEMTIAVNPVGTVHRSERKVDKNLQRTAKNELLKFCKEQRKTGGGPSSKNSVGKYRKNFGVVAGHAVIQRFKRILKQVCQNIPLFTFSKQ